MTEKNRKKQQRNSLITGKTKAMKKAKVRNSGFRSFVMYMA